MNRRPDFIIIGAMKCATSSLHEQLARQCGIFMSTPKEPCFFSDDEQYARGSQWYASLFADAKQDDICGESSTHYTKLPTYPNTIKRLKQYAPDVKLIYVMRHPVDRLVSQYIHEWTMRELRNSIDRAIDQIPRLVDYSRYAMQLQPYLEAFGPHRVLPVFFERLTADPQAELERICRFIGYVGKPKWQTQVHAQNISAARQRTSPWRDAIAYAPGLSTIRQKCIPRSWRNMVKSWWQMSKRPEISPDRRDRLIRIFDADLAQLSSWLDTRFDCDDFKQIVVQRQLEWSCAQAPSQTHSAGDMVLGAVAIGRNEGPRLERCLQTLCQRIEHVVYVDSGSSDNSIELAHSLGVEVVELDTSSGFTMARGRNAGFEHLLRSHPEIDVVQFVDGDCEIGGGWPEAGLEALRADAQVAAVSGRRTERHRNASRYNRLTDMEWDTPIGFAMECHGDVMIRVKALLEVGGFNASMICGEEPELCVRLRQRGWKIQRIDQPMSLHDAAMFRFSQWWQRSVRGGWAYAEGAAMHGQAPERHWVRQSVNNWLYGALLPLLSLGLAWWTYGVSLLLLLIYVRHLIKVYGDRRRHGDCRNDAWLYALFATIGKFPAMLGQCKYWLNRWCGRSATLIEYKNAPMELARHNT